MNIDHLLLFRIALLLYAGLWVYLKVHPYRMLRRKTPPSVYEIEKFSDYRRGVGWLGLWGVVLIFSMLSAVLITLGYIWEHIQPI